MLAFLLDSPDCCFLGGGDLLPLRDDPELDDREPERLEASELELDMILR